MGELRRVRRRGNSWVIAVPYTIREHLGVDLGTDLYWHLGAKGEAHLTTRELRRGGKPPGQNLERALAAAQQTIGKLQRQARNRPSAVYNEGVAEGFSRNAREVVRIGAGLEALTREVRDLAARIPFAPRRAGRRVVGAVTSASAPAASIDHIPTEPLPSGVVSGGDAASGGEAPQAAHRE
jgi:hypothetical protein